MAAGYSSAAVTMGHLALKRAIRHAEANDLVSRNVGVGRLAEAHVGLTSSGSTGERGQRGKGCKPDKKWRVPARHSEQSGGRQGCPGAPGAEIADCRIELDHPARQLFGHRVVGLAGQQPEQRFAGLALVRRRRGELDRPAHQLSGRRAVGLAGSKRSSASRAWRLSSAVCWLGEVVAIKTTLSAATQRLKAQLARLSRHIVAHLGMPGSIPQRERSTQKPDQCRRGQNRRFRMSATSRTVIVRGVPDGGCGAVAPRPPATVRDDADPSRAAGSSAGRQHANSSASWSSPAAALWSSSAAAHSCTAWRSFPGRALSRRRWSSARRRATQPPGLAGKPSRGHCSTAAAHASCAQSSASDRAPASWATVAAVAGHHAARRGRSMSPLSAAPSPSPAGPRPTRT